MKAEDYPDVARRTIREMHRQVGPLVVDRNGLAVRGVLVRHLVMPGATDDAREIFRFLAARSRRTRTSTSWNSTTRRVAWTERNSLSCAAAPTSARYSPREKSPKRKAYGASMSAGAVVASASSSGIVNYASGMGRQGTGYRVGGLVVGLMVQVPGKRQKVTASRTSHAHLL